MVPDRAPVVHPPLTPTAPIGSRRPARSAALVLLKAFAAGDAHGPRRRQSAHRYPPLVSRISVVVVPSSAASYAACDPAVLTRFVTSITRVLAATIH